MQPPFAPIPRELEAVYRKLRVTLWTFLVLMGLAVAYTFLFPTVSTSFDFRNPKSSRNQIFDPRSELGIARTNGKLEPDGILIADTSPFGDFSQLSIAIDLEKRSELPSQVAIEIRKGYRAFRYPIGESVADFPTADLYRINGTVYMLRDGSLHPFISEAAFHSRYPADWPKEMSAELLARYPIAPDFSGFRVGSLISFADGVYIVTSETEIRPIGSAEIFLALGYSFDDVVPVSEEDLGIYKRGRIFLMGAAHPDGTLFQERSTGQVFIIDRGQRRPVAGGSYRDFLLSRMRPIAASEAADAAIARCDAVAGLLPRALGGTAELGNLSDTIGPDYEIQLAGNDTDIDIASLTLAFSTRLEAKNAKMITAKMKQRIFARFGFGQ